MGILTQNNNIIKHSIVIGQTNVETTGGKWGNIKGDIENQNDLVVYVGDKIGEAMSESDAKYQPKGDYLTQHQDLSEYAKKSDIPAPIDAYTKIESDSKYQPKGNYLTQHQDISGKANIGDSYTKAESDAKYQPKGDYLTQHQDLSEYALKSEIPTVPAIPTNVSAFYNDAGYLTEHQSLENYYNKSEIDSKISDVEKLIGSGDSGGDSGGGSTKTQVGVITMDVQIKPNSIGFDPAYYRVDKEFIKRLLDISTTNEAHVYADYITEGMVDGEVKYKTLWSDNYTLTGSTQGIPGFWFGSQKYSIGDQNNLVSNTGFNDNGESSSSFGIEITEDLEILVPLFIGFYEIPNARSVGEEFTANVYMMNEFNKKYIKFIINVHYVEQYTYIDEKEGFLSGYKVDYKEEVIVDDDDTPKYLTKQEADEIYQPKGDYLTEHQDLSDYAKKSEIPTDVSAFNNDAGYLTKHQSLDGYAKLTDIPEVPTDVSAFNNDAGYLTKHQDLSDYAKKADLDDLKLYKFPNATIFGNPTINDGQVSGFSDTNYLQFPFLVDFNNRPFEINMCFTTGSSLGRQNNIIDSNYGLAIAIREMKFVVALSSNGTSWNLNEHVGSMNVTTDTTYYVKFSWDGTQYKLSVSQDKVNYSDDIIYQSSETLYPKQIKIGTSYFGAYSFTGSINLNYCNLIISSHEVWQGMDDVGLATRLATDLSNIDSEGERKIKDIIGDIPSLTNYYTKSEIDNMIGDIENILKTI